MSSSEAEPVATALVTMALVTGTGAEDGTPRTLGAGEFNTLLEIMV